MKLTMIQIEGKPVPALLLSDGKLIDITVAQAAGALANTPSIGTVMQIIDLDGPAYGAVRSLSDRLEAGDTGLIDQLRSLDAVHDNETATYAQLLDPRLIVSCGMGYKDHLTEMDVAAHTPSAPIAFLKAPNAQTWHGAPIVLPPQDPDMVDFECEFACVVGRSFHNLAADQVMQHIAGYTMISDVGSRSSAREFINGLNGGSASMPFMEIYVRSVLEKQFPTFCPMGPVIHTADSFGDPADVRIGTRVNGETMQAAHTSNLIFPLAESLSYYSRWYRFQPGDVLTTGSPSGVGMSYDPPRYLKAGDVLETWASGIGTLKNPVVAG